MKEVRKARRGYRSLQMDGCLWVLSHRRGQVRRPQSVGGPMGCHERRLAAKDINTYNAPELFAATPPTESLKFRLSMAAMEGYQQLMHIGVYRAYFYADRVGDVYLQLPPQDQTDDAGNMCVKLAKAMYCTRSATHSWQRECTQTTKDMAFSFAKVSPCHFYHDMWNEHVRFGACRRCGIRRFWRPSSKSR